MFTVSNPFSHLLPLPVWGRSDFSTFRPVVASLHRDVLQHRPQDSWRCSACFRDSRVGQIFCTRQKVRYIGKFVLFLCVPQVSRLANSLTLCRTLLGEAEENLGATSRKALKAPLGLPEWVQLNLMLDFIFKVLLPRQFSRR